jgi:hypothetical protein
MTKMKTSLLLAIVAAIGIGLVLLCHVSFARADIPSRGEEDPFQVDAHWKGKLTQRGTNPNWGSIPPELNAELVITQRDGDDFQAELHENTDSLAITFICKGKVEVMPDRTFVLRFETTEIKAAQAGTVGVTGAQYVAKFTGKSIKGDWHFSENNQGISLEGDYELLQE